MSFSVQALALLAKKWLQQLQASHLQVIPDKAGREEKKR